MSTRGTQPCLPWTGKGPHLVHFLSANGFMPEVYQPLFSFLDEIVSVCSSPFTPLENNRAPESLGHWSELADELVASLRTVEGPPLIGMGHSLGAVTTLLAAQRAPSFFRALVLIDPVLFTGFRAFAWNVLKKLGQGHRIPLTQQALRRRDTWPSRDQAKTAFARKAFFKSWQPDVLDAYVEHGLVEDSAADSPLDKDSNGPVRLRYSKAWEARIFETTPANLWHEIKTLQMPVLLLRGAGSDALSTAAFRRFARTASNCTAIEVANTGHLLPMEAPERLGQVIGEFVLSLPLASS